MGRRIEFGVFPAQKYQHVVREWSPAFPAENPPTISTRQKFHHAALGLQGRCEVAKKEGEVGTRSAMGSDRVLCGKYDAVSPALNE